MLATLKKKFGNMKAVIPQNNNLVTNNQHQQNQPASQPSLSVAAQQHHAPLQAHQIHPQHGQPPQQHQSLTHPTTAQVGAASVVERGIGSQSESQNRLRDTQRLNQQQENADNNFQHTPNNNQKPAPLQFASQTASRSNMTLNQSVNNGNRNQRLMSSFDKKNTQQSVQNVLNANNSQGLIANQVVIPKGGATQVQKKLIGQPSGSVMDATAPGAIIKGIIGGGHDVKSSNHTLSEGQNTVNVNSGSYSIFQPKPQNGGGGQNHSTMKGGSPLEKLERDFNLVNGNQQKLQQQQSFINKIIDRTIGSRGLSEKASSNANNNMNAMPKIDGIMSAAAQAAATDSAISIQKHLIAQEYTDMSQSRHPKSSQKYLQKSEENQSKSQSNGYMGAGAHNMGQADSNYLPLSQGGNKFSSGQQQKLIDIMPNVTTPISNQYSGSKIAQAQHAKINDHLSNRKMKNTFNIEESLFPSPISGPHYTDGNIWKTGSVSHGISKRFTSNNNAHRRIDLSTELLSDSRIGKNKLVSLKQAVGLHQQPQVQVGAKSSADTACTASSTNALSDGTSQFGPARKIPFNQQIQSYGKTNYINMNEKRESAQIQNQPPQTQVQQILSKQQRNSSSPTTMHMSSFRQQQLKQQAGSGIQYSNQNTVPSLYKKKSEQSQHEQAGIRVRKGSTRDYDHDDEINIHANNIIKNNHHITTPLIHKGVNNSVQNSEAKSYIKDIDDNHSIERSHKYSSTAKIEKSRPIK